MDNSINMNNNNLGAMAKSGEIQGVGVAHRKDSEYLKSLPDGTDGNNLGNLPSISESTLR